MIEPATAYAVTRGVYDEYQLLAVFTERRGAQEFADHHNLTTERYSPHDKARVEDIDLYRHGWRRPATSEVLDGHVAPAGEPPPALPPAAAPSGPQPAPCDDREDDAR